MTTGDRIEKRMLLRAPMARVWRALTDAGEFGTWFRMKLDGPFQVGRSTHATLTYPGYEHIALEMTIERMDGSTYFSYRWHPYPMDPAVDYAAEPTTLVEFRLEEVAEGTLLTVVESGFDQIPAARRDEAFRMNDKGWSGQLENIRRHVGG
jgi:uncharacterized protein YndB with AHSA1/START domain